MIRASVDLNFSGRALYNRRAVDAGVFTHSTREV